MKKFTFKTREGCQRILALLMVIILASSFCAALVSSDFGKVKVTHVTVDMRGGVFDGKLYIPVGTSSDDKLPAVVVCHGRGTAYNVYESFAEELARRGFVALAFNAYGAGLSDFPSKDENGQGADGYSFDDATLGVIDAVNYLRSVEYVDKTRIGVMGHSGGSRRTGLAATLDCGFLTRNDVLINLLCDTFGVTITEDEIYTDADELARKNLNDDQLVYWDYLKAEAESDYDQRIKAICLVGSDASRTSAPIEVQVGGHTVMRSCQVNMAIINGEHDFSYNDYNVRPAMKEGWYTDGADIQYGKWYEINDQEQSSQIIGDFGEASIADDSEFANYLENSLVRVVTETLGESHTKNFLSPRTTSSVVYFFEQTLNYNRGDLTDPDTVPLDVNNSIFMYRQYFNAIAMLAMFFMIFPLTALFLQRNKLSYDTDNYAGEVITRKKSQVLLYAVLAVVITFVAVYLANYPNFLPVSPFHYKPLPEIYPLSTASRTSMFYVAMVGLESLILLVIAVFVDKKSYGKNSLKLLNIRIKPKDILRYFCYAFGIIVVCYIALMIIVYLFNQEFKFWALAFLPLKGENWAYLLTYALAFFPGLFFASAAQNYTIRTDIPKWKDTLFSVIINSAGIWLCCLISIIVMNTTGGNFSSFIGSYNIVLVVPITAYVSRKCFNMTKSIWLGAFVNALFVSWCTVSYVGVNDIYVPMQFFSNLLNV